MKTNYLLSGLLLLWSSILFAQTPCQNFSVNIEHNGTLVYPQDSSEVYISLPYGENLNLVATGDYPHSGENYTQTDELNTFTWDMGDGANLTGNTINHLYNIPYAVFPVTLTVTDTNNCSITEELMVYVENEIDFGFWGIDGNVAVGDTLFLSGSVENDNMQMISDTVFLPDGSGVEYVSSINFDGFEENSTIESLNDLFMVTANMEHSYLGDLDISITCPSGGTVLLQNRGGGGTFLGEPVDDDSNMTPGTGYDYSWSPSATTGTLDESAQMHQYSYTDNSGNNYISKYYIPSGTYEAHSSWDSLLGCPMNGNWEIKIIDNLELDNGYIFSWNMSLNYINAICSPQAQGWTLDTEDGAKSMKTSDDVIIDDPNTGNAMIIFNSPGAKELTFTVTNSAGIQYDTVITVNVTNETTLVEDISKDFNTKVGPNPFREYIDINYSLDESSNVEINVFDITGKFVKTVTNQKLQAGNYSHRILSDELSFRNGIYLVQFNIDGKSFTKRIMNIR